MQDKRLTHRLTDYWNQLREDLPLPKWQDFNPKTFSDIWKQCCGFRVDTDEASSIVYTYEYVGESIVKVIGKSLKDEKYVSPQQPEDTANAIKRSVAESLAGGLLAGHFNNFPAARILQKIDRIVKRPALVIEEGRAEDKNGKSILFRSCLLPFGTEEGKVTHIVLGLSWKTH